MKRPSLEGAADRTLAVSRRSSPESFAFFCRRLLELSAADRLSWIASARVDSTSSQARRFVERFRDSGSASVPPCCFLAWEQSGGRGRGGRKWSSRAGLGLYMTLVLTDLPATAIGLLPMVSAVVVARQLSALLGIRAGIKWPNDVLSNGRKLAGILVEAATRGDAASHALVGIGINVHHTKATLPLPTATSLAVEGLVDPDMALLAFEIGRALSAWQDSEQSIREVVEEYRSWSEHKLGDEVRCHVGGELVTGEFAGFGEDGAFLLEHQGRILQLRATEIVEP